MSLHTGVSCDACMRTNFPGRRYKCLLCDNYDLCGSCYDLEAESQNHKNDHPMQCILTETACELFYAGETIPRRSVVSLTCPHCGLAGFISRTLLMHCVEKHPSTSPQTKNTPAVMCPICVTSPSHRNRSRFTVLTDHMLTVHDDGTGGGDDEDSTISLSITKTRRDENEEEDSDEDDDEEEESSLNDLEHRAFIEEEQRRQEAARQRLAHASSLAAVIRNEYAAGSTGNTTSQRRPLIRQTAIRGIRGGLRGHFNNFPYGAASRTTTTGLTSSPSNRGFSDTSTGNASQNTPPTDPYTAFVFAQDPMLEFVSRLVNNQQSSATSSTNTSNSPFLFTPSMPTHVPSSMTTTSEFSRLQEQIENNESINSLKSTLLNSKQKRSSHTQQQQQSSSSPSMILSYPLGYDYQLWQQNFSAAQPTINNLSFLTGTVPADLTTGNSNSLSKSSQQLNREYNPRSLLGKILRNGHDVNNDETNETRTQQLQNHMSFLQSILFSSMTTNLNEENNENELIINKENFC